VIFSVVLLSMRSCELNKKIVSLFNNLGNDPKFKRYCLCFESVILVGLECDRYCKISQMPTFIVYKGSVEATTVLVWDEGALRSAIKEVMRIISLISSHYL
jgi:hypothetical protein